MLPSSDKSQSSSSPSQQNLTAADTSPLPILPPAELSKPLDTPRTTGHLASTSPFTTRKLTALGSTTSTKLPILIPATEKRSRISQPTPRSRRRHPMVLISVMLSGIVMFAFATFFASPLDLGQHSQTIVQTIDGFFSSKSLTFNPMQHVPTPTATPALLTNEGSCGGTDIWGTCATAITASGVMGTGQMAHPISGAIITQAFGLPEYQSWCGCVKPHSGIDLAAPYGTAVTAADSGQVIWTGWDWSGLGWAVKINHGHYIATIYGHLARFIVKTGQNVTKGDVIAYEGSTGASTGPHVHFMVLVNNIWVDPSQFMVLP